MGSTNWNGVFNELFRNAMPTSRNAVVATPDSLSSGIVSDRSPSCCPSEDTMTLTMTPTPQDSYTPSPVGNHTPRPASPRYYTTPSSQLNHQPPRRLPTTPHTNAANQMSAHNISANYNHGSLYVATGLPHTNNNNNNDNNVQHLQYYSKVTDEINLDDADDVAYNNDVTAPNVTYGPSSRSVSHNNSNVPVVSTPSQKDHHRHHHRSYRSMTPIIDNANIRNNNNNTNQHHLLHHLYLQQQQQQQRGRQALAHHERSTSASRLPVFIADSTEGEGDNEGRVKMRAAAAAAVQGGSRTASRAAAEEGDGGVSGRRASSQPRIRPKTPTSAEHMQQQIYFHQLLEKPRLKEFLYVPYAQQQQQQQQQPLPVSSSSNSSRMSRCPSRGPLIALPQTPRSVRESLPQGITVTNLPSQGQGHVTSSNVNNHQHREWHSADNLIDILPDAVLVNILSYLPSHQLCQCATVCRRWSEVVWNPTLWKVIDLQDSPEWIDVDKALKCLTQRLSLQTPGVCAIVDTIRLAGCTALSDKGLYAIAKSCHELRFLDITGCHLVTNIALFDVFSRCPSLVHLTVAGCINISCLCLTPEATVQAMTYGQQSCLAYLDMGDCSQLQDSGLQIIASYCPRLTCLYLRRCTRITDVGVQYIAAYCRTLGELSVSDCQGVTDTGVQELACKLGLTLHYLSVGKCRITDTGVRFVATYCRKLRYLNMRGCEGVTDASVQLLARNCARLRSLDIGKCDVTDASLACLAVHCGGQLRKLGLKECIGISDAGLLALARGCPGLQQLNISQCPTTLAGYKTVRRLCKDCVVEHTNL